MPLTLLYILKTVGLGYHTFRISYWEIFEIYLECHLYPLQHSAMKKPTWKYEMWHFYGSGSSGGGLFCETRWSCRHTSIMEEPAASVFRWKVLSFPIILCVTPFEVPVTSTSHYFFIFVITIHHYFSTHWPYANTRRLVLPQFFSVAKVCKTVVQLWHL